MTSGRKFFSCILYLHYFVHFMDNWQLWKHFNKNGDKKLTWEELNTVDFDEIIQQFPECFLLEVLDEAVESSIDSFDEHEDIKDVMIDGEQQLLKEDEEDLFDFKEQDSSFVGFDSEEKLKIVDEIPEDKVLKFGDDAVEETFDDIFEESSDSKEDVDNENLKIEEEIPKDTDNEIKLRIIDDYNEDLNDETDAVVDNEKKVKNDKAKLEIHDEFQLNQD